MKDRKMPKLTPDYLMGLGTAALAHALALSEVLIAKGIVTEEELQKAMDNLQESDRLKRLTGDGH